ADPDDDAPAVWSEFHGLRTGTRRGGSAEALNPYSDIRVLASGVIPVARYKRVKSPSAAAGCGGQASVPRMVGRPATSTLSLMNVGTPLKKPALAGAAASARARSKASWATPFRAGLTASVRAIAAS